MMMIREHNLCVIRKIPRLLKRQRLIRQRPREHMSHYRILD